MPRSLVFKYKGTDVSFQMSKVDRAKLYGFKELEVLDEQGRKCELATLADDGRTVVARGGTGMGTLDADGNWVEKASLKPVNLEGDEIEPVKSSFSAPVELSETVTIDQYMDHTVRAIYTMDLEGSEGELGKELAAGKIFKFDYSFRGGLEADAGFLLMNDEKKVFFAVGSQTSIEMVGLQQTAATVVEDDTAAEDDDLMDFGMI